MKTQWLRPDNQIATKHLCKITHGIVADAICGHKPGDVWLWPRRENKCKKCKRMAAMPNIRS